MVTNSPQVAASRRSIPRGYPRRCADVRRDDVATGKTENLVATATNWQSRPSATVDRSVQSVGSACLRKTAGRHFRRTCGNACGKPVYSAHSDGSCRGKSYAQNWLHSRVTA